MRVIAGEFRSRRLKTLPDLEVRPTPDRLRESLFNILAPVISGAIFVDAYAGVGTVGIEALSRGAQRAIFIEKSRAAAEVIQENLATLGLRSRSAVRVASVHRKLLEEPADIVFLDPPYPLEKEYAIALDLLGAHPPSSLVIVQHSRRFTLQESYGSLKQSRQLCQGDNQLTFYKP